jgi:hypothetical protein
MILTLRRATTASFHMSAAILYNDLGFCIWFSDTPDFVFDLVPDIEYVARLEHKQEIIRIYATAHNRTDFPYVKTFYDLLEVATGFPVVDS